MKIIVLDSETTGLDPAKGDKVIELCMITYKYDGARSVKGDEYLQRFNPQRSIASAAQAVHKISFEMVAHEPTFAERATEIEAVINAGDLIVAHNLPFDMGFICAEFIQAGLKIPKTGGFDTCNARWATPYGKIPKLEELCFALGIEYDRAKAHSALYDVQVLADCFFKGLDLGFFNIPNEVIRASAIESIRPEGKNFAGGVS